MRLFVAIVPPEEVVEHLAEHLAPRVEAGPDLLWADRDQWHVTLAFLGAVSDRRLDEVTEAIEASAGRREPQLLRVAGAGAFPNPYAARVLWAGVETVQGDLDTVASGIRTACNSVGATPDGARFRPHLTLARFGRPAEATRWIRALEPYQGPQWRTEHVSIVESHLSEGRGRRPRYEVLAEVPLG
ncbi:MAG: RNA 2',3'-cyclic phosphodiesterase [Terracoccus sp.]